MLRLTLLRHAEAAPARDGEDDWERTLEARGERDARRMGSRLKEQDCRPDRILSSPAVRALRTAHIVAEELSRRVEADVHLDDRLYLASPRDLMSALQELGGEARHVMLVGHNPGLTEFADALSSERSIQHLPTCGMCWMQFDVRRWTELVWASGVDVALDYPGKA